MGLCLLSLFHGLESCRTLDDTESRVQTLPPVNQIIPSQEPQAATYALKEQASHTDLTGLNWMFYIVLTQKKTPNVIRSKMPIFQ